MRRKDREVKDMNKIIDIIDRCDIVRIGLSDGDYPYIVPLNFSYTANDDKISIYIHGAMSGRKYEMLKENPCCSFEMDIPVKMECIYEHRDVTMRYQSVMGKAKAVFIEDSDEKKRIIDDIIMARYEMTKNFEYNVKTIEHTAIIRLDVFEITGKANYEGSGPDI